MRQQLLFLSRDWQRIVARQPLRWLTIWLQPICWALFWYRFERGLFLAFGDWYKVVRIPLMPLANLAYSLANFEVPYSTSIGGGLQVLHPAMGIVVNAKAEIGSNLTLVGGNVIGLTGNKNGKFILGDGVHMGANATIIGPLELAEHIVIGANACVIHSCFQPHATLAGVPAKELHAVAGFKNAVA